MALSLDQMAAKGYEKLTRKSAQMKTSWDAAKGRMKTNYGSLPFGGTRKSNYNSGVDAANIRFDPDKWRTNWLAKMSE